MTFGKFVALAGILLGVTGLILNFTVIMPDAVTATAQHPARDWPNALIYYFSFFTHLTNLGLVLVYLSDFRAGVWLGWFRRPTTRATMGAVIILVMLYYHFMLAPLYHFTGNLAIANVLLHYVTPILYLAWWGLFSSHGALRFAQIPLLLLPPLIYLIYVLVRGAIVAEYPYEIVDVGKYGYGQVTINAAVLTIAVALFTAIVVGADKLIARWRA
jgi:hypothetical protein